MCRQGFQKLNGCTESYVEPKVNLTKIRSKTFSLNVKTKFTFKMATDYVILSIPGIYASSKVPSFRLIKKDQFSFNYKVRKAIEPDNDWIIPLIEMYTPRLTEIYGEYYVSEIIRSKEHKNRQIIVCELNELIVGVLFTNLQVNYQKVNYNFDLECYQGLKTDDEYKIFLSQYSSINLEHRVSMSFPVRDFNFGQDSVTCLIMDESSVEKESETEAEVEETELQDSDLSFSILSADLSSKTSSYSSEDYYASTMLLQNMDLDLLNIKGHKIRNDLKMIPIIDQETMQQVVVPVNPTRYWKIFNAKDGNAFAIEVLIAYPGHEDCIPLMLDIAFVVHKHYHYAVLSVPSTCEMKMIQKYFVKVSPQPDATLTEDLYIVNKYALLGEIEVKQSQPHDLHDIQKLLYSVKLLTYDDEYKKYLWENLNNSYVFYYESMLFGFAIVKQETNVNYFVSHYNLRNWSVDSRRDYEHGRLEFFTYSPIFQNRWQLLLSELHRHSGFKYIYYVMEAVSREKVVTGIIGKTKIFNCSTSYKI